MDTDINAHADETVREVQPNRVDQCGNPVKVFNRLDYIRCQTFFFFFFPVQQTTSGINHRVKN